MRDLLCRFPAGRASDQKFLADLQSFDIHEHLGAVNELVWWSVMVELGWRPELIPELVRAALREHVSQDFTAKLVDYENRVEVVVQLDDKFLRESAPLSMLRGEAEIGFWAEGIAAKTQRR